MVSGQIHIIPDKSSTSKYHVQTMHGLASHGPKKSPQSAGLEYFIVCLCQTFKVGKSFPLNRSRWLTADVIYHAGNTVNFVDNAVRHAA